VIRASFLQREETVPVEENVCIIEEVKVERKGMTMVTTTSPQVPSAYPKIQPMNMSVAVDIILFLSLTYIFPIARLNLKMLMASEIGISHSRMTSLGHLRRIGRRMTLS
jgi:hypothetical protein